jgi:hypothetical protein
MVINSNTKSSSEAMVVAPRARANAANSSGSDSDSGSGSGSYSNSNSGSNSGSGRGGGGGGEQQQQRLHSFSRRVPGLRYFLTHCNGRFYAMSNLWRSGGGGDLEESPAQWGGSESQCLRLFDCGEVDWSAADSDTDTGTR